MWRLGKASFNSREPSQTIPLRCTCTIPIESQPWVSRSYGPCIERHSKLYFNLPFRRCRKHFMLMSLISQILGTLAVKPIPALTEFDAQLQILELLDNAIFTAGYKAILHIHSVVEDCEIVALLSQMNPKTKKPMRKKVMFVNNGSVVMCEMVILPKNSALPVSLKILEHEIFTVSPIKEFAPGFRFAPLWLIDMYNAGGVIDELRYKMKYDAGLLELENISAEDTYRLDVHPSENGSTKGAVNVYLEIRGCGRFGAYSSVKPTQCIVDSLIVDSDYDSSFGLLTLILNQLPEEDKRVYVVEVKL